MSLLQSARGRRQTTGGWKPVRVRLDQEPQQVPAGRRVVMRTSRVGAVAALLVVLFAVSTTTASAATSPLGTTVNIGLPGLAQDRVLVSVPVDVSCSSSAFSSVNSEVVVVEVRQASGQSIAFGMRIVTGGPLTFPPSSLLFPCDDATHTVFVPVQASGAPFHGGPASVIAFVSLDGADSFGIRHFDSVREGPVTVGIRGGCVFAVC
jgi:hypothetical protein